MLMKNWENLLGDTLGDRYDMKKVSTFVQFAHFNGVVCRCRSKDYLKIRGEYKGGLRRASLND